MCTLTFLPTEDGYLAGMNRDELLVRPPSLAPEVFEKNGLEMVYPREGSGGTWIAGNSLGNLLALLNWNPQGPPFMGEKHKTRGMVIPELVTANSLTATVERYHQLNLEGVFPFRLVGAFLNEKAVWEWRWDGSTSRQLEFAWERMHWFSSSVSDASAEAQRGRICETAALQADSRSKGWVRSLHRSHLPEPGPFSVCVHRADAATVSYTEIRCQGDLLTMDTLSGNPCQKSGFDHLASILLRGIALTGTVPGRSA